jgi:hypothetical protein
MATIDISWVKSDAISIRDYANSSGFNLNSIDLRTLEKDRRDWIEKTVVDWIISDLDETYAAEKYSKLSEVKQGLYIISLADDLCIRYPTDHSQVIYVGRGTIRTRIRSHLKEWVLNFSESLQDIRFQFWMSEVRTSGGRKAFREAESDLLDYFWEKNGDYPILNKISGSSHEKEHSYSRASYTPFRKSSGLGSGWALTPMPDNDWFKPLD